ncbi:hypothetical protein BJV74DRAFT_811102 [Russula compacta]|nr:hypothetical protein BJV74DRAFT_811102 [Russula compacta]
MLIVSIYYTPMPRLQTRPVSASSSSDDRISVDTRPAVSMVPYQIHTRQFASNSGSGKTTWYFSKSKTNIPSPPVVPQAETGHLYVHFNGSMNTYGYWIVSKGSEYPLNHDRVLSIRNNGEPSWVTRASITTMQCRKEREIRIKSVHAW